jgi:hypothetical protein
LQQGRKGNSVAVDHLREIAPPHPPFTESAPATEQPL